MSTTKWPVDWPAATDYTPPSSQKLAFGLIHALLELDGTATCAQACKQTADVLDIPDFVREIKCTWQHQTYLWLNNKIQFARQRLVEEGIVLNRQRDCWELNPTMSDSFLVSEASRILKS